MFGKVFAGIAAAGVLAGVLTTGALAAPAGAPAAAPTATHRHAAKDVFQGTVTAINEAQLTVKNGKGEGKTFLRTDKTIVVKGRKDKASWSEIEINSHVRVRYEERDGKTYARRIHVGRARVGGTVETVSGNVITLRTRDGKDVMVTVSSDTRYVERDGKAARRAGSLSEIHAGERLVAAGAYDPSHTFDAALVVYRVK
jgi:hypothetical protein